MDNGYGEVTFTVSGVISYSTQRNDQHATATLRRARLVLTDASQQPIVIRWIESYDNVTRLQALDPAPSLVERIFPGGSLRLHLAEGD
jgi:hypothetical protein